MGVGCGVVKGEIMWHFQSLLVELMEERPMLYGVRFKQLSFVDCAYLAALFSLEEIKEAVWR